MSSYLDGLNPQQKEAAQHTKGPVLILAGAGTGKTRTITHRIAYMIAEQGIPSRNILAVTFTNKAAREMKERVQELLPQGSYTPTMGTFHSVSARILRENIHFLGYEDNYSIYDTDDSMKLAKAIFKELHLDPKKDNLRGVMNLISSAKNRLLTPERFADQASEPIEVVASEIYKHYQRRLKQSNAVDFNDLIMLTTQLFQQHPQVLKSYQDRWHYIHVDEYQDINYAQHVWTKLLSSLHNNLCVVGDDWQGIYSWRGANVENILHFAKEYPGTKTIKLEENYRSTQIILDAAQNIIKHNTNKTDKKLWTQKKEGDKIQVLDCANERQEGDKILLSIQKRINRSDLVSLSEAVILYRTNAQSRALEEACLRNTVPYQIIGGTKFYERMEIKDILAYLKVISNPQDEISLTRIINTPKRSIGKTTWLKVVQIAQSENKSIWQALQTIEQSSEFNGGTQKKLQNFVLLIQKLQAYSKQYTVSTLIQEVIDMTDYIDFIDDQTEKSEERIENLQELQSVSRKYDQLAPEISLTSFLEEVALISSVDNEVDSAKLTLMTIHAAKGLEFQAVYIAGMEEQIFPHMRSLYNENEMEEERRLAYVAITRAKQYCHLSYCQSRMLYGDVSHNKLSRFIDDIPDDLIKGSSISTAPKVNYFDSSPRYTSTEEEYVKVFTVGQIVTHPSFGKGEVLTVRGDLLTVKFSAGVKTIATSIAPIH